MKLLVNKAQPWLKIDVLTVIYQLVNDDKKTNFIFRANIKEDKHYFALLKVFRDSFYDVQTICAKILRTLDLESSIRDKIFSFMNTSICPPEERDVGVNILDFNSHHNPCFKSNTRNIFDESEDLKETLIDRTPVFNSKTNNFKGGNKSTSSAVDYVVNRRNTKYLAEMKNIMDPQDDSSSKSFEMYGDYKRDNSNNSSSSYSISDSNFTSAYKLAKNEEVKTQDFTQEEAKVEQQDIDPVDNYLNNLIQNKMTRDAPIPYDVEKLEFESHRKSGKSTSPRGIESERQTTTKYRTSTNIPITTSFSSEENLNNMEYSDENSIPEELSDLYHVCLSWIFSSK